VGNCLFLRAREWGIDGQGGKKLQISGGMPGGGMVTGRIEPCITSADLFLGDGGRSKIVSEPRRQFTSVDSSIVKEPIRLRDSRGQNLAAVHER